MKGKIIVRRREVSIRRMVGVCPDLVGLAWGLPEVSVRLPVLQITDLHYLCGEYERIMNPELNHTKRSQFGLITKIPLTKLSMNRVTS